MARAAIAAWRNPVSRLLNHCNRPLIRTREAAGVRLITLMASEEPLFRTRRELHVARCQSQSAALFDRGKRLHRHLVKPPTETGERPGAVAVNCDQQRHRDSQRDTDTTETTGIFVGVPCSVS